jgi:hypothetical protein
MMGSDWSSSFLDRFLDSLLIRVPVVCEGEERGDFWSIIFELMVTEVITDF